MTTRQVRFFGSLREYGGAQSSMSFEVSAGLTAGELRKRIAEELGAAKGARAKGLVLDSALGDDRSILRDSDRVPDSGELCLLPPVCGG